nr:hypothetical protein [Chlamydiota bacterium]
AKMENRNVKFLMLLFDFIFHFCSLLKGNSSYEEEAGFKKSFMSLTPSCLCAFVLKLCVLLLKSLRIHCSLRDEQEHHLLRA